MIAGVLSSQVSEIISQQLVQRAIADGLITIDEGGERITYHLAKTRAESLSDPEEPVRAWVVAFLILERGYAPDCLDIEVPVQMGSATKLADVVLYKTSELNESFLVVECVRPGPSDAERRKKITQGFSYAINLGAPYVGYASDDADTGLWEVQTQWGVGERKRNSRGPLLGLGTAYTPLTSFSLYKGDPTKNDLSVVQPERLERAVRRAHSLIWAGGKRDPLEAFSEWSKLLFAKLFDEWETRTGEPYHFQIAAGENESEAATRITARYTEARRRDPSVFSDELNLPPDKIVAVVEAIQHIDLWHMPLDGLGQAFEQFFGSVFRGDLGQYFTRREIVRFVVAALDIAPDDRVIDPTAGSGGFLLEVLIQVKRAIPKLYASDSGERQKDIFDKFAKERVFGIEINERLGRVCQTNVTLHQDGHTNIVVNRSALDREFGLPSLRFGTFTVVVGNPPFGGKVEEGAVDQLGQNTLSKFQFGKRASKVASEFLVVEQAWNFLEGGGRLGMVVPDGMLNNAGERSLCPLFRRWLLTNARLDAVVSLPDFAFRKSGAQNKTSLLFFTKLDDDERTKLNASLAAERKLARKALGPKAADPEVDTEALRRVYAADSEFDYAFFVAEAEHIGYTPSGGYDEHNDLYATDASHEPTAAVDTILFEYECFKRDRESYTTHFRPTCAAVRVSEVFAAHSSIRLDPKFHAFREERLPKPPAGMTAYHLGEVLHRRLDNRVKFTEENSDNEFTVLTLQQTGNLKLREPGIGKNPPDWRGQYLAQSSSRWSEAKSGDIVFSSIDLWKGCVSTLPAEFDGAIFTSEFPIDVADEDTIDSAYLKLLLRSRYFQRAIRAVTTGHSNRRRTQVEDFEMLTVYLPDLPVQKQIGEEVRKMEQRLGDTSTRMQIVLSQFDHAAIGDLDTKSFLANVSRITDPDYELTAADLVAAADERESEVDPFGAEDDGVS